MRFFSLNLYSLDCSKSAEVYSKYLNWKIISSSKNHSELLTPEEIRVIFSAPGENCPVSPGSFTLFVNNLSNVFNFSEFRQEISHRGKENYDSYLDEYGNRIWVYEFNEVSRNGLKS
jgi:hypothetical protein